MEPNERSSLLNLYQDLDAEIQAASPRCDASGRCCRFTEYGHTLFLSELEAELLLEPGIPPGKSVDRHTCPYQRNNLCMARDRRPLGCRVYFCDPRFADRQVELSEAYLGRLKRMHDEWGRPWRYRPLHDFLPLVSPEPANPVAERSPPAVLVEIA